MTPHVAWDDVGSRALTASEREHTLACEACRHEGARMTALRQAVRSTIPVDLAARVQLAAASELARRPNVEPWVKTAGMAVGCALVAALPALLLPVRGNWNDLDVVARFGTAILTVATFLLAGAFAFWPGLRVQILVPLAAAVTVAVALVVTPGPSAHDPSGLHPFCLVAVLGSSAAPLAALLILLRQQEVNRWRGMLAAVGAGALGEWLVYRHCSLGSLEHMLGSHLAGWALLIGLGAWLGEKVRIPLWPASRR
jgi:anti-sigma factor RsiW